MNPAAAQLSGLSNSFYRGYSTGKLAHFESKTIVIIRDFFFLHRIFLLTHQNNVLKVLRNSSCENMFNWHQSNITATIVVKNTCKMMVS